MRLFFAVEIPEELRHPIAAGVEELRRSLPPARWVRPEGVHITLQFLGEQPEGLVNSLVREVEKSLAGQSPVTVALAGGGFFPSLRRPRVAWLGGRAEGLAEWAQCVQGATCRCGVAGEEKGFAFHITLARLPQPWPLPAAERFLHALEGWRLPPFPAREVVLFASELGPGGARYTPLRRIPVGGR